MCLTFLVMGLLLQVTTSQCAPAPHLLRHARPEQQGPQLLGLQELQQLEALQKTVWPPNLSMSPIVIVIQNAYPRTADETTGEQTKRDAAKTNTNNGIVDDNLDSIIIEADPEDDKRRPQRMLLQPGRARLSIGDVISAIPFLPIEINVPDTIGWAYNGISSIISIFGRQPVAPGGGAPQAALRAGTQSPSGLPLLLLPLPHPTHIHLPIQV